MRYLLLVLFMTQTALADGKCVGRFMNPITDVCWSCIFPISIGGIKINNRGRDTDNPKSPVCLCNRGNIPVPGITLGFWEPIRLIEITRTPYCLVSMGGVKVRGGKNQGGFTKAHGSGEYKKTSFYHVHYYASPLIYWLNLLTDFGCLEEGGMDLAYMSELDPAHNNDKVANFMNPEVFLTANPIAIASCSLDCVKANLSLPIDSMFWCAGCLGSMYPFSGHVQGHIGGVQASSLLATRAIAKMHRLGMARRTATDDGSIDGKLCKTELALKIPKSQYKLQMTYPIANSKGGFACNPLGMADILYNSGKEFPYKGEDFVYLLWRKRNCCFL